eukprot:6196126-Pleurochrysis_carterae.AAC.1
MTGQVDCFLCPLWMGTARCAVASRVALRAVRAARAHVARAVRALSVRVWAGASMHAASTWLRPGCVRRVG